MRHTSLTLAQAYKVTAGLGHHGQSAPVLPKESNRPGTNPVLREKFQGPFLVYDIVGLLETRKDLEEDRPPHVRKMLDQLRLEGGGPCIPARIVICDFCREPDVEKACNRFPEDLDDSNPPEVPLPFWN